MANNDFASDENPSGDAVKKAYKSKFPKLITDNLDQEYKKAVLSKQDPTYYIDGLNSNPGVNKHSMTKNGGAGMKRSASSFTVDRVFDVPHNPFRTRQAIETPQNLVELYQRFRFYFQREPLVGTALELHTEFPLSTFQVVHEDPTLSEFFNDMAQDMNLFEFILDMVLEHNIVGEAFPCGMFDDPKNPERWERFILMNPLNMDIASAPITDGKYNTTFRLKLDQVTKDIVSNGPNHKVTGDLYNRIPQDIKDACKGDGYFKLPQIQLSHFKRRGNYFKVRGESMLYRIMHLLSYRDKLRDAQYCHPKGTEVLTDKGFMKIEDITLDHRVMTYNKNSNEMEYQNPTDVPNFDFNGNLLHFKNRKVDFTCTPNHRMLVQTTTGNWKVKLAKDVKHTNRVKAGAIWKGDAEAPKFVNIYGTEVPIYTFLEYAGYYVSEGYSVHYPQYRQHHVSISQSEGSECFTRLKNCMESMPFKFNQWDHSETPNRGMNYEFHCSNNDLQKYMETEFGGTCYFKKIPTWIKQLAPEYLEVILKAACDGDGSNRNDRKNGIEYMTYSSVSKQLIDDIEEISYKCGYYPGLSEENFETKDGRKEIVYHAFWSKGKKVDSGLWLKKGEKQEDGTWSECEDNNSWMIEEHYEGKVYCLTVPNSFFVTRQNGRISIHGNSIADRNISPREVWKVGETGNPATEEELSALSGLISGTFLDPTQAIVWHHALQVDTVGGADKVLPLRQELDGVSDEMLTGLWLNKGFLDSNYGAYANMSVALDVLISRYLILRQNVERWMREHVWAPICRIHNLYKPTQAELSHRIRVKNANKRPWVPETRWDKQELKDNSQKVNLLLTLREKLGSKNGTPGFPKEPILQLLNFNSRTIQNQLTKEAKQDTINNRSQVSLGGGGGGSGGGPAGGGLGGGGLGDLGVDVSSLGGGAPTPGGGSAGQISATPNSLPEFNGAGDSKDLSQSNPSHPPASNSIANDQTPVGQ